MILHLYEMAGAQVIKKLDNSICNDSNNGINTKDGLACASRSKRRRNRRKNKTISADHLIGFKNLDSIKQVNSFEQSQQPIKSVSDYCLRTNSAEDIKVCVESRNETDHKKIDYTSLQMDNADKRSVIAQRHEKKQAKLAAKIKSKNKNDNIQVNVKSLQNSDEKSCNKKQNEQLPVKPLSDKDVSQGKVVENIAQDSTSEQIGCLRMNKAETLDVNKETNNSSNAPESENSSSKLTKSREEIKAEREARRQLKLNSKLKTKVAQESIASENVTGEKPVKPNEPTRKESTSNENEDKEKKLSEDQQHAGKSKAELKAERRAKQEAQRAAKEADKLKKLTQDEIKEVVNETKNLVLTEKKPNKEVHRVVTSKIGHQRVKLFSHLKFDQKHLEAHLMPNVHPAVVQLGLKYSSRIVLGSNARCVALLNVLKEVIMDYITPSEKEFLRALDTQLSTVMAFLNNCRPSSVSMINAVRHIKSHLTQLSNDISETEARRKLCDVIDTFIREQIDVAGEAICNAVQKKITNGDNILIYACSSLLYRILVESHKSGKQFTVVVVDSGPWFEGREMLRRLVDHGIKCSYVLVSALSFIMREVSKVLLGAHALLANGSVMSRAGSALVALVANSNNVPVLVCCETYKFCERVQMDAFVYNELGNDKDMEYIKCEDYKENESSAVTLSVLYDITPADLVTAVVTEVAILPCTSVPVILRIKPSDVVS